MKLLCGCLLACVMLAGCSEQAPPKPMTIEEKTIGGIFTTFVASLAYDEVCNGTDPKSRWEDLKKPENVNLIGTQQMLAARLGGLMHLRQPKLSTDDLVKLMVENEKKYSAEVKAKLGEVGCESELGAALKKSYEQHSKTNPGALFSYIDQKIVADGGTVTPPEAFDKPVAPESNAQ